MGVFLAAFLAAGLADFLAAGLAAFLGVLAFLAAGFLAFLGVLAFLTFLTAFFFLGFSTLPSLKDPLTATRVFFSTPAFKAFLRWGASLTMSTLQLAAMYFLMAAR